MAAGGRQAQGRGLRTVLFDHGRSMVGAYIIGLPVIYTMETWWIGRRLQPWVLATYALMGLALVMAINRFVGFREREKGKRLSARALVVDFVELVTTGFLASYAILFLFGIITLNTAPGQAARIGLVTVVPMAFGSALANKILSSADDEKDRETPEGPGRILAIFALGSIAYALPFAHTEEMALMTAHAGWGRLATVVVAAVVITYVTLYELRFKGHEGRADRLPSLWLKWGEALTGYAVAFIIAGAMLAGLGQFSSVGLSEAVGRTITLSFIASFGGAAAQVVI